MLASCFGFGAATFAVGSGDGSETSFSQRSELLKRSRRETGRHFCSQGAFGSSSRIERFWCALEPLRLGSRSVRPCGCRALRVSVRCHPGYLEDGSSRRSDQMEPSSISGCRGRFSRRFGTPTLRSMRSLLLLRRSRRPGRRWRTAPPCERMLVYLIVAQPQPPAPSPSAVSLKTTRSGDDFSGLSVAIVASPGGSYSAESVASHRLPGRVSDCGVTPFADGQPLLSLALGAH